MRPGASNPWPDDDVILYDGVCVFCSRWIRFVAARDRERRFRFAAIQSGYGARLARVRYGFTLPLTGSISMIPFL